MQCPICKDIALVMTERQSIEIDYCPQCRGVWLDRGELDKIIERSQRQETVRLLPQNLTSPVQSSTPAEQPGYNQYGNKHGHGDRGATAVDGKKVAIKVKVGIRDNRVAKNRFCRNYLIKMAISRL